VSEERTPQTDAAREPRKQIVLYGPATAPFTEKVRRALMLKGLDFELREPESPEDYRRWSPETGLLPVLAIEHRIIADSTQILFELDALYPEPPLLSLDPIVAEQQRQLEDWTDASFSWLYGRSVRLAERRAEHAAHRRRALDLRSVAAWLRAGGTWERPEAALLREVAGRMDDLVNFLGSRPFFYADRVSMADLCVYSMLRTIAQDSIVGSAKLLAERPTLGALMRRVEEACEP
jgi:glutathione S-transferase